MTTFESVRPYPLHLREQERLAVLRAHGILDSSAEPGFDRVAVLAARLFEAPISLVSLVDDERQWFKAKLGLEATQTPRVFSFCTYAMLEPEPMVVCDATRDLRFANNPLVTGPLSIRPVAGWTATWHPVGYRYGAAQPPAAGVAGKPERSGRADSRTD